MIWSALAGILVFTMGALWMALAELAEQKSTSVPLLLEERLAALRAEYGIVECPCCTCSNRRFAEQATDAAWEKFKP